MKKPVALFGAIALAAILAGGLSSQALAQGAPQGGAPGGQGGQSDVSVPNPSGAPPQSAAAVQLPVLLITSVEVMRSKLQPTQDIVRVRGVTGSAGWNSPELVPLFEGKPSDNVLDLQFIAQVPATSQPATGFSPVAAIFPLEPGHPYTGVRVRGAGNVVLLKELPGTAEGTIKVLDCSKCIGMRYASKGEAPAGTPGVVREEEMPRNFRVIPPTKGVAGITHNMNRLNIVLGEDNKTIIQAFWE